MNIENEIFKRYCVNFNKLTDYGFKKESNNYVIEKNMLNNDFKAIITISSKGKVTGKVIETEFNEEYSLLKTEAIGEFVSHVREAYKDILIDIRKHCFEGNYFISDQTNRINSYINNKYHHDPEFLWDKFPGCAIYRNKLNNKWYAIIMNVDYSKLEDNKTGEVEVMNVKLNEIEVKDLLNKNGYYKSYHMRSNKWITIILNNTIPDLEIFSLIDKSYKNISESNKSR